MSTSLNISENNLELPVLSRRAKFNVLLSLIALGGGYFWLLLSEISLNLREGFWIFILLPEFDSLFVKPEQ